jgi:hypothetical protein
MGGEEVVHHHHHHHQMVDAEVLQKHVGLGHGCDVVVGDAVPHHCVVGVGEVAHYLHLMPLGEHVDGETHGGNGGHGVDVHLDHGKWDGDHHGHVGDDVNHLVGKVDRRARWRGELVDGPHGEVVDLDSESVGRPGELELEEDAPLGVGLD